MAHQKPVKAAVITGNHPYDVLNFQKMFKDLAGIEAYPQNMEDFVTDTGRGRELYDALLFYNMHLGGEGERVGGFSEEMWRVLKELGHGNRGIFLLHHSLLAFREWEVWRRISGIDGRTFEDFHEGERVKIEVERKDHPITEGLDGWEMTDEVYEVEGAAEDSEVLLTTDHPKSMATIGWTREYKDSRVFCFSLGHDDGAFSDGHFRKVVERGLKWTAGRSPAES